MTKDLAKSDVGVARITMSRPLRTSSATGTEPVWANSQSPRMSPAAASGPPTAMAGSLRSMPRFLKTPASAPARRCFAMLRAGPSRLAHAETLEILAPTRSAVRAELTQRQLPSEQICGVKVSLFLSALFPHRHGRARRSGQAQNVAQSTWILISRLEQDSGAGMEPYVSGRTRAWLKTKNPSNPYSNRNEIVGTTNRSIEAIPSA